MPRVLVIDDEQLILTAFSCALTRAGYEVETAHNGRAGVERFRAAPADLVITDIVMPEQDGFETIAALRQACPRVKVVAISGGGDVMSGELCLQIGLHVGADHVLSKPVSLADLLATVKACLPQDQPSSASAHPGA